MRILGIDPGSITTGFGIIYTDTRHYEYVASGCIKTGAGVFSVRLKTIYTAITELIRDFKPDTVAIEQVFIYKNVPAQLNKKFVRFSSLICIVGVLISASYFIGIKKQSLNLYIKSNVFSA